jgi:thymidylate synthase (FAD)
MSHPEIPVLDRGFVRLIDHMGTDLTVVNAARVSFGKRKEAFDEKDAELVDYLAQHEHTAPFRHAYLTFHVKAPIFVFRQWMKHRIASDFNEISGRYVEFREDEFYVPEHFRQQAKVNKQGSEGEIDEAVRASAREAFLEACHHSVGQYKKLIELGVCREQASPSSVLALYFSYPHGAQGGAEHLAALSRSILRQGCPPRVLCVRYASCPRLREGPPGPPRPSSEAVEGEALAGPAGRGAQGGQDRAPAVTLPHPTPTRERNSPLVARGISDSVRFPF